MAPFAMTARPAALSRPAAARRASLRASRTAVRPLNVVAPERGIPDSYKSADGSYDLVKITSDAYLAFRTGGEQGLPLDKYWGPESNFIPAFPVLGFQPQTSVDNILTMFSKFPEIRTFADISVVPTELVRAGNRVFVYEDISSPVMGSFEGMAVHTFNDEGVCVESKAFHDSKKQDSTSVVAKEVVLAGYAAFARGDLEYMSNMMAPGFEATWVNPDGAEKFDNILSVVEKVVAGWPTFRFEDSPIDIFAEGNKVFCTMNAKTDNGMDVIFGHFWTVDIESGKLQSGYFFDDSMALAKSRIN